MLTVWIRGAGELASATALTLKRCGLAVVLSELPRPLAIRRTVTFSDALFNGTATVEEIRAAKVTGLTPELWTTPDVIPVTEDRPEIPSTLKPRVIVDGRMLKQALPDQRGRAAFTIGLGPGFTAGENCHAAVETQRGHDLGRVLWDGAPQADTAVPGILGGAGKQRVIYAPGQGKVTWEVNFGEIVTRGQTLGRINNTLVTAPLDGLVRGLIHPATPITKGLKIGDVDPRGRAIDYRLISDKARTVARGALEAILMAEKKGIL